MPFRAGFDCLWCGQAHATRSAHDLEGWASLCPTALAGPRTTASSARLRTALRERATTTTSTGVSASAEGVDLVDAEGVDLADADDFYLRQGRFAAGPLMDVPWQTELDQVTRWLDDVVLGGVIVELVAGTGWWSPLLAQKGELWVYEADDRALEMARRRLVAHGLRAHLHRREAAAQPDRQVDAVFAAFLLGTVRDEAGLASRLEVVRGWLRPGGAYVFVEAQRDSAGGDVDGPRGRLRALSSEALRGSLARAGFEVRSLARTAHAFLMGEAVAVPADTVPADTVPADTRPDP